MRDIWQRVSFGVGRKNAERVEHPVIDAIRNADVTFQRGLVDTAAQQLGTVGSGNHYVDLFADEADDTLWIGVHFGSRGFGHKTATWALEQAGAGKNDSMDAPPTVIETDSQLGEAYAAAMMLAGRYAYAGREWVVGKVLSIVGARGVDTIHNHHNFAWVERHGDRDLWVHRKGATPAFPNQRGFVGGTMGECAVILRGVDSADSSDALYSTVHGAGRAMSRTQAAGKSKTRKQWVCGHRDCAFNETIHEAREFQRGKDGSLPPCPVNPEHKLRVNHVTEHIRPGLVDWDAARAKLVTQGIVLIGAGADEAPEAYKRLDEVLGYHAGTVVIEHRLRPIGVAMAGPDTFDPYKD